MEVFKKALKRVLIVSLLFSQSILAIQEQSKNPVIDNDTTFEDFQRIVQKQQRQMLEQQQQAHKRHLEYVKNYKSTMVEQSLRKGYDAYQFLHQPQEKEGFWTKLIKTPYRIGSMIYSPVEWAANKFITPLLARGIARPTYYTVDRLRHRYITPDEKLKKLPVDDQQHIHGLSQYTADAATKFFTQLSSYYTDKLINAFAEKFLKKIISVDGLPKFEKNPGAYKDAIVRRILHKFDQTDKAYEYYLKGKRVYGHAKLVYDLADNISAALATAYQFTHHAQIHGRAPMMIHSRLKKLMMGVDIFYRCADSYLKIVKHFNLEQNASQGIKTFQKWLSRFAAFAKVICPWQDYIVGGYETGKALYEIHQLLAKPRREMIAFLKKQYGMNRSDANKLYDLFRKLKITRSRQKLPKNIVLEQNRRYQRDIDLILKKHGTDFKAFYHEFNQYNLPQNQMERLLIKKYRFTSDDAKEFVTCLQTSKLKRIGEILSQYNICQATFDQDPEIQNISIKLMMQVMEGLL